MNKIEHPDLSRGKTIVCAGGALSVCRTMRFDHLAPGEVNRARAVEQRVVGRPLEVARAVRALGGTPIIVGFLDQLVGQFIQQALQQEGLTILGVQTRSDTPMTLTLDDESGHARHTFKQRSTPVDQHELEQWLAIIQKAITGAAAVVFCETPLGPVDLGKRCEQMTQAAGLRLVRDMAASDVSTTGPVSSTTHYHRQTIQIAREALGLGVAR